METPTMVYSRTLLTCSPFHGSQSYDTKEASSMIAFSAQAKKFPQFLERFFFFCNLFVTSKNETTNSPIHQFKVLHKGQRAFKTPFLMVYVLFLIYYFKKHFKPCFFLLKTFCSTLNS